MKGIEQYRSSKLESASGPQVLIMLYEEAIRRLRLVTSLLENGDNASAQPHLGHIRAIFVELTGGLDDSSAPDLVLELRRLYDWALSELLQAGADGSADRVRSVTKVAESLLEGWRLAIKDQKVLS